MLYKDLVVRETRFVYPSPPSHSTLFPPIMFIEIATLAGLVLLFTCQASMERVATQPGVPLTPRTHV